MIVKIKHFSDWFITSHTSYLIAVEYEKKIV